jgi:iron(III) transport system substrate-binding protein
MRPRFTIPPAPDRRAFLGALAAIAVGPLSGCGTDRREEERGASDRNAGSVVVYAALDREFSEPILDAHEKATGVRVLPKFDIESTKTVGLTNLIIAESDRPRCDVFWNNEILNTLRLQEKGLLERVSPTAARPFPTAFKDPEGAWHGFAGRARALLVNTRLVPEADRPRSILDLTDPRWKGKLALAKPLFGTTATHATCLFATWGAEKARAFFRALKANDVQVVSGNKQSARAVGAGDAAIGLTDTDDALGELAAGSPVAVVFLDRNPGQLGTLFLPNTLALLKGAPHRAQALGLLEYLLSPEVEAALARGPSGQIPLNPEVSTAPPRPVESPKTVHPMTVDWTAAVSHWNEAAHFLTAEFGG